MNGYDILTAAARLTGIQQLDENLKIIGLTIVNSVLEDMGFLAVSSLGESVGLPSTGQRQTLIYGVAMLICNALGDAEGRKAMSDIYYPRLALIKGRVSSVRNIFPKEGL